MYNPTYTRLYTVQCMFAKNMVFLIFIHHVVDGNHSFLFISSGIPWCEWTTVSFFIHLLMDIWVVSSLDLLCIKITFWPHREACGNLVPGPGIKPTTPALEAWSLTYWTTREVKVKSFSHVQLFGTPWTITYQAPQSVGFSRPEYWSGVPFPSPGDLPDSDQTRVSGIVGRRFTIWATRDCAEPVHIFLWTKKKFPWTSLVVQWIRIHLPMQGTRVQPLVWEDSTCQAATVSAPLNYWAHALEPTRHSYWNLHALRPARHN